MSINYYLSPSGISKFKEWLESIPEFNCIKDHLDELKELIITGNSILNYNTINTIKNTIKQILILQYEVYYKQHPEIDFNNWLNTINQYCFQGGYGYRMRYLGAPHHWCIKPEYYDLVKNIPEHIYLACILNNNIIEISDNPDYEYWSL